MKLKRKRKWTRLRKNGTFFWVWSFAFFLERACWFFDKVDGTRFHGDCSTCHVVSFLPWLSCWGGKGEGEEWGKKEWVRGKWRKEGREGWMGGEKWPEGFETSYTGNLFITIGATALASAVGASDSTSMQMPLLEASVRKRKPEKR